MKFLIFAIGQSFFDYTNGEYIEDFNKIYKCLVNRFHKTIPNSRIIYVLSTIDGIILKIFNDDIDEILKDIQNLRENILYMISFEKTIEEESDDDDDDEEN